MNAVEYDNTLQTGHEKTKVVKERTGRAESSECHISEFDWTRSLLSCITEELASPSRVHRDGIVPATLPSAIDATLAAGFYGLPTETDAQLFGESRKQINCRRRSENMSAKSFTEKPNMCSDLDMDQKADSWPADRDSELRKHGMLGVTVWRERKKNEAQISGPGVLCESKEIYIQEQLRRHELYCLSADTVKSNERGTGRQSVGTPPARHHRGIRTPSHADRTKTNQNRQKSA